MSWLFANPAIEAGTGRRGPYRFRAAGDSFIRGRRVAMGLTQPEAAKHCGVSLRTFQRAELGDVVSRSVKRAIERSMGAVW
jgi:hypothetical protein